MSDDRAVLCPGELIPSFTLRAVDGQTVRYGDYRGRRHLVLCFLPDVASAPCQALLTTLGRCYASYRAAGAEVLALLPEEAVLGEAEPFLSALPYPLLYDAGGLIRDRFGVPGAEGMPLPALFVTDRYGEVALAGVGREELPGCGLPLDDVLPTLELLQVRCSI